ncbi:MAG: cell division protein ZapA [Proteobacteria bacterium]|nr:cell division protein ZapA [Pseudomonadota bacterium]
MGQIVITVNEQNYTLACRDGEEDRLMELSKYVNSKAETLTKSMGQVGETRVLLMASLLLADEALDTMGKLDKARAKAKKAAEARIESKTGGDAEASAMAEIKVATLLSEAADAIEGIAAELENA